jgi:ribosomal protein L29
MKTSELRAKSQAELQKLLAEKRAEMAEKRLSLAAGELTNPRSITKIRRDIAVLLTILNNQPAEAEKEEEK